MDTYEKKYKEALKRAKKLYEQGTITESLNYVFPELAESDERIRKALICGMSALKANRKETFAAIPIDDCIAWLEKQGNTNETIDRDEFAQGVLRGAAINLITWIDYNAAEGNMCLSNTECKDIEDALVSGDWNKIYAYMKKKLERQDEQKHIFDFNANNWYVSKVDGKIHNIYNSGVEPKFSEKKELKKIENSPILSNSAKTGKNWSEEDEKSIEDFINHFIEDYSPLSDNELNIVNWLKSLKQRMEEQ